MYCDKELEGQNNINSSKSDTKIKNQCRYVRPNYLLKKQLHSLYHMILISVEYSQCSDAVQTKKGPKIQNNSFYASQVCLVSPKFDFSRTTFYKNIFDPALPGPVVFLQMLPVVDLYLQSRNRYLLPSTCFVFLTWWNKVQCAGFCLNI